MSTRWAAKPTLTAMLLTAYSRIRSHPMIHAISSPMVAYVDLQAKSWLPFFRLAGCSVGLVVAGGCAKRPRVCGPAFSDPGRRVHAPPPHGQLCTFRLATGQLLHLAFLRPAGVLARLKRLFGFTFLARRPLGLFAFLLTQTCSIRH